MEVTTDVPGFAGFSRATAEDFPLVARALSSGTPAEITC